jgi:hypothetical protein
MMDRMARLNSCTPSSGQEFLLDTPAEPLDGIKYILTLTVQPLRIIKKRLVKRAYKQKIFDRHRI